MTERKEMENNREKKRWKITERKEMENYREKRDRKNQRDKR